jgi:hypothetical protein
MGSASAGDARKHPANVTAVKTVPIDFEQFIISPKTGGTEQQQPLVPAKAVSQVN